MSPFVIEAHDLVKSYSLTSHQDTPVLKGVSLQVKRGELLAIIGASGAGKSTLLQLIGALDEAEKGSVTLHTNDGKSYLYAALNDEKLSTIRNRHIGFIFQFHHLLPEFTALENVMMPALIAGKSAGEATREAMILIEKVGVATRKDHKPSQLSGGEQQRIAFARALINKPAVVLADEPTGNLDTDNSDLLLSLLQQFREEYNQTFVVVTHSPEIARQADRRLRMKNGILEMGIV